ncbi:MAG: hypothetical protein K2Q01_04550 [Rickettsiales bacterium]|nr:hypothetical protein [Rickettsiales bacterium]
MPLRFSDFRKGAGKPGDFAVRRYDPGLVKLVCLFFAALVLGIGITSMLLTPLQLMVALTLVMAALGTYVIVQLQRTRDLLITTEYQNAMFASALAYNCRFCLIMKREGSIVYMDTGIRKMYPDLQQERQITLSNLLKLGKVGAVEREKILDMVQRGQAGRGLCDMRSADNRLHQVMLELQPIHRPSGFLLLRGRDYVERSEIAQVTTGTVANPLLSKASISMFAHIMNRMGMGLYMIDMGGNMLYANKVLEKWLSFKEGDITTGNFSMRDIVHGITLEDALSPGDFEGENSLLKKEGGIIKAYINQKIIYGDNDKPLGCVALITNTVESDSELKKKLW